MCKTKYFWAYRLYNYAINLAMYIDFFCWIELMGTTTLTPQPWKLLVTVTSQLE